MKRKRERGKERYSNAASLRLATSTSNGSGIESPVKGEVKTLEPSGLEKEKIGSKACIRKEKERKRKRV